MPSEDAFVIDDTASTSDNLAAYVQLLKAKDASLAAALSPHLASLANGQEVNAAQIWTALYEATAPVAPPAAPPPDDGVSGAESAA